MIEKMLKKSNQKLAKKIFASMMLPIFVFQMASLNFLFLNVAYATEGEAPIVVEKSQDITGEEEVAPETSSEAPEEEISEEENEPAVETEADLEAEELNKNAAPVETVKDEEEKSEKAQETTWDVKGKVATIAPVKIGEKYVAPQNEGVTVTFSKLPEKPGSLSIEEINLTQEQQELFGAITDKAYDITSDMENGTFEYDLTLPKPENEDKVEVKFAKNVDGLKEAETVSDNDVEIKSEKVNVELNHMTVFVVVGSISGNDASVFDESESNVLINEFLYNPSSGNEWVELYNKTNNSISLDDWEICELNGSDGKENCEDLSTNSILGKSFALEETEGLNNNGGDTIIIKNDNGKIIDKVSYKIIGSGATINGAQNLVSEPNGAQSIARTEDGGSTWIITNPTKNFPNNSVDSDGDQIYDHMDNCPLTSNQDQIDIDGDGLGNVCDPAVPTIPQCNESSFDNFFLGSVNGQGGWSVSGPYDQRIVDNTFGYSEFGCKTLRLSNAITSGSFGDQTFSPSNVNEAGELSSTSNGMSGGTRQNHFEAQFDFASTQSTQQPGLFVSISPDRGDGSRMSYLGFSDEADGIKVIFYDTPGETNPANFSSTTIKTGLSRTAVHTVKFVIDYLDGPSNDIVKIYIDGDLVHEGTTWENYYRFDNEASAEQSPRTTDNLLFRAGGSAAPATAGNGFIFDNYLSESSTIASPSMTPPTVPILVSPANGAYRIPNDSNYSTWSASTDSDNGDTIEYFYQSASDLNFNNITFGGANGFSVGSATQIQNGGSNGMEPAGITYYWRVRAQDNHGNSSAWSTPWQINTFEEPIYDTTIPSVIFTNPANGAIVNNLRVSAEFDGTGSNLIQYGFDVTGPVGSGINFSTRNYTLNQSTLSVNNFDLCAEAYYGICEAPLPEGEYKIRAKAYDSAGNRNISTSVIVVYDNTKPTVKINLGRTTYIDNGDIVKSLSIPEIEAFDKHLTSIEVWKKDGNRVSEWTTVSQNVVTYKKINWLTEGTYIIRAIDKAGLVSEDFEITIDNTAPTFMLTDDGNPRATIADDSVINPDNLGDKDNNGDAIRFSKELTTDTLYVNNQPIFGHGYFNKGTSGQIGAAFKNEGVYMLYVKDEAGNQSTSITFTVDKTVPKFTLSGIKYSNGTVQDKYVTNWNTPVFAGELTSSDVASIKVTINNIDYPAIINGNEWIATISGALADGNYNMQVVATDNAGNITHVEKELIIDTKAPTATYKYYKDGQLIADQIVYVKSVNQLSFKGEYTDTTPSAGLSTDSYVIFEAQDDGSFKFSQDGKKSYCGWRHAPNLLSLSGQTFSQTEPVSFVNCIASLPDGEYYMAHQVADSATRKDIPSINQFKDVLGLHFIVDTNVPDVPGGNFIANDIEVSNNGFTNSERFTFNLSSSDETVRYQLKYWNDIPEDRYNGESNAWNPTDISGYSSSLGVYNDRFSRGEGVHHFKFSACDFVGNCSAYSEVFTVTYDKSIPELANKTTFSGWYNSKQVSTFQYIDDNMNGEYEDFTCQITSEGANQTCSVSSSICDEAGNCYTAVTESNGANIDWTDPTSTINGGGDNEIIYSNSWDGKLSGTADDNLSGVSRVKLSIQNSSNNYWNGSTWQTEESLVEAEGTTAWNYVLASVTEGSYTIKSHAMDNAGNVEDTYTLTIVYDKTIPEINLAINPNSANGENGWYDTIPEISLTANDKNLDKIEYQIDSQSGSWLTYSAPLKIQDGKHIFYYRSLDKAGNYSGVGVKNVKVDTHAPDEIRSLEVKYDGEKNTVKLDWSANDSDIYQVYVYRGGSRNFDTNSGSRIAKNNDNDKDVTDRKIARGEKYYYKLVSVDEAGNKSDEKNISVEIPESGEDAVVTDEGTENTITAQASQENNNAGENQNGGIDQEEELGEKRVEGAATAQEELPKIQKRVWPYFWIAGICALLLAWYLRKRKTEIMKVKGF